MNQRKLVSVLIGVCALAAWGMVLVAEQPAGGPGSVSVTLCDGKTQMEVPGLRAGERLNREQAQQVAGLFLARWREANPGVSWQIAQAAQPPAPRAAAAPKGAAQTRQSEIYNRFSARDEMVWKMELEKFVKEGNRIFHDAEAFGGTVGVSCDMCHPDASNTHPETYPKYQVQLQRVALLRDMINWCIQHPAKGRPLADEDPRLRAMEAYIISQRKGKSIEPGKH